LIADNNTADDLTNGTSDRGLSEDCGGHCGPRTKAQLGALRLALRRFKALLTAGSWELAIGLS
jgi:hypothetical protein